MTSTSKMAAGLALAGFVGLCAVLKAPGQDDKKESPLPKEITWKLKGLNEEPLRVVTTRYDPKGHAAFWVLELVRDLDVFEDITHWGPAYKEARRPRFRFELHNADGIVLRTIEGQYIGEYVNRAGKRFGVVVELPEEYVKIIKTVEVVTK